MEAFPLEQLCIILTVISRYTSVSCYLWHRGKVHWPPLKFWVVEKLSENLL